MTALVGILSALIVTAVIVAVSHFLTYGELRVDRGSRWVCVTVVGLVTACLAVSLGTMEWGRLVLAGLAGAVGGALALYAAFAIGLRAMYRKARERMGLS